MSRPALRATRLRLCQLQVCTRVCDSLESHRWRIRGGGLHRLPPANHECARRRALRDQTGALKQFVQRLLRRVVAVERCGIDAGDDVLGEDDIQSADLSVAAQRL